MDGQHPLVRVANGTHANYPDICEDNCTNWDEVDWLGGSEASHDGKLAWAFNATPDAACGDSCVADLNTSGLLRASYDDRWGLDINMGFNVSDAPRSPDNQKSQTGPDALYTDPTYSLETGSWEDG
jgi:hypothetical protein